TYCVLLECCLFFFFSSRRRHTRLVSDWSSDVCSSDLHRGCSGRADACERARTRCRHHTPNTDAAKMSGVKTIMSPAQNMLSDRRSAEHTSELQSLTNLVCRLLLE